MRIWTSTTFNIPIEFFYSDDWNERKWECTFWKKPPKLWTSSLYDSELSTERVSDPVELEQFQLKPWDIAIFFIRTTRSRLSITPKVSTTESTMDSGVHCGKVQPEMMEWEPHTINESPLSWPFVNSLRKTKHTGQQRFDTPITHPWDYFITKR